MLIIPAFGLTSQCGSTEPLTTWHLFFPTDWIMDANSLCLQISDVSYNFQEKINFSPDMQEKGSNLPRDSPHHVFVQLLAKRKNMTGNIQKN